MTDTFPFQCPACGTMLNIPTKFIGASGKCNKCGATITIQLEPPPVPQQLVKKPPPIPQRKPVRKGSGAARDITYGMDSETLQLVRSTCSKLFKADNLHPRQVAKHLEFVTTLDDGRRSELERYEAELREDGSRPPSRIEKMVSTCESKLLREFRIEIAATESAKLQQPERYKEALALQATLKAWVANCTDCEDCLRNEAQGPIPIKQEFACGQPYPPTQPGCGCQVSYGTERSREVMIALAKDRAAFREARKQV